MDFKLLKEGLNEPLSVEVSDKSGFASYELGMAFYFVKTNRSDCGSCCLVNKDQCDLFACVNKRGEMFEAVKHKDITFLSHGGRGFREDF